MKVFVKYFASLRERMGRAEQELEIDSGFTVRDIWLTVNKDSQITAPVLCAVNQDYADWETQINDGDEVAFFPPVTGG